MKFTRPQFVKASVFILILLAITEIILRMVWGIGKPPLYTEDPDYEYIYAPNQDLQRMGHHFRTNSLGMRSDNLSANDSIRILLIGDSVINGGAHSDNEDLAGNMLSKMLSDATGVKVNVLNISAGSWGPDNAAAFIKKHGDFNAESIVLVFSSHDAYDFMQFDKVVGVDPNYPEKNPSSALTEIFFRYVIPGIKNLNGQDPSEQLMISKKGKGLNPGWKFFKEYAEEKNIDLHIYLHSELSELEKGNYNPRGHLILAFADSMHIPVIKDIEPLNKPEFYRDFIHINSGGQKYIAEKLFPVLLNSIKSKQRLQST